VDETFEAVRALLQAARSLEDRRGKEELSAVRRFMQEAHAIETQLAEARRLQAPRFNIFETLGVCDNEAIHSRVLAFLFDPRASHDQGTLFVQSFLDRFLSHQALPAPTIEETFVHREFVTPYGRLDVAVFLPQGAYICIENKVWAFEQQDQISRYQRYLSSLSGSSRRLVIFLSPTGEAPETIDPASHVPTVSLSYDKIAAWLENLLPQVPAVLGTVLAMYAKSCSDIATQGVRVRS
jgi:hypothetical protein